MTFDPMTFGPGPEGDKPASGKSPGADAAETAPEAAEYTGHHTGHTGQKGTARRRAAVPADAVPDAALAEADALFLRTFRNLAGGPPTWHAGQQEIWSACSIADMERVLESFERLISCLSTGARRRLPLYPPGSPGVTTGELAVLNLVAAAQAGAFGHVTALAQWLVVAEGRARLLSAATQLAAGLAASGVMLGYRRCRGAPDLRMPHGRA